MLIHKLLGIALHPAQHTIELPGMLNLWTGDMSLQSTYEHKNVHPGVSQVCYRPKQGTVQCMQVCIRCIFVTSGGHLWVSNGFQRACEVNLIKCD